MEITWRSRCDGIVPDRSVHELAQSRERANIVEFLMDGVAVYPEDSSVEVDVFATGEIWLESGPKFEKGGDTSAGKNPTPVGWIDSSDQL